MIVTRADNDAVLTTEDVLLSLCHSVTGVLSAATQSQVRFSGMVQRISKRRCCSNQGTIPQFGDLIS